MNTGRQAELIRIADTKRLVSERDKVAIGQHLVQPWTEDEFKPLLQYRGALPLGRIKTVYNYFCAAMERELPNVGNMASLTSSHGYLSELAHSTGFHAEYSINARTFHTMGTRLLAQPQVMNRTPHLQEYLEYLRDEGGLKLVHLTAIRKYLQRVAPIPLTQRWPFVSEATPRARRASLSEQPH